MRPSDVERLLRVPGIGEKKAGDFGGKFLGIIERYAEEHGVERDVLGSAEEAASR